jgi:small subunit ribosomal protein S8
MSTVTDPIADFLARVRNGTRAQKPEVLVPYSKIKAEIARILKMKVTFPITRLTPAHRIRASRSRTRS